MHGCQGSPEHVSSEQLPAITGDWSFLFSAHGASAGMLRTEMLKSVQG